VQVSYAGEVRREIISRKRKRGVVSENPDLPLSDTGVIFFARGIITGSERVTVRYSGVARVHQPILLGPPSPPMSRLAWLPSDFQNSSKLSSNPATALWSSAERIPARFHVKTACFNRGRV
jgi:hypothetical protein